MLFQHINRHADKHRKRVYIVLVVVIGLSFVVWVTPRGCDDLVGPNANRRIGRVFGQAVTQGEFLKASQRADVGNFLATGQWLGGGGGGNEQLTALTMQRLMALHEARTLGLAAVAPEEFQAYVKSRPVFQTDGRFDGEKLANFRENVTRGLRMTGTEFDLAFKENIAIERLEARASQGIVVSPVELRDAFNHARETFAIRYAEVKLDAVEQGEPAEAELAAHFAAHRENLRLPEGKTLRVARFPAPTDLAAIEVDEARIDQIYEGQKDTAYQGQTLEEARPKIREQLARSEARNQAIAAARAFREELVNRPEGETHAALLERFAQLAESHGATVADTPPIRPGDTTVPGFEGMFALAREAQNLEVDGNPIGNPRPMPDGGFVPVLVEVVPGGVPETLAEVREQVVEAVLAEQGKAIYAEHILPHAEQVKGLETVEGLAERAWHESEGKSTEERIKAYWDTLALVNRYLKPAFKPEQRTAWVVEFRADSPAVLEAAAAKITEERVRDHFKSNPDYHRHETRASQILVTVPRDADEEARAALRQQAEELLARVRAGEPFADVARAESQDQLSSAKGGDLGFAAAGVRPRDIEAALAELEVGEMTEVVEIRTGFAIFLLTDQRDGREFADVANEIRQRLRNEEARLIAQDEAADFADEVAAGFEQALAELGEDAEDGAYFAAARDVFAAMAEETGVPLIRADTPFARDEQQIHPRIGRQESLVQRLFDLAPNFPFSTVADEGNRQFVAMLGSVSPGRFYDLETEADILRPKLVQLARQETARAAARAEAEALRESWLAALAEGDSPEEINDIPLTASKPFSRREPDYAIPHLREIMDAVPSHAAGTMLEPIAHDRGFVVVRLENRTLPPDEAFTDEARQEHERQLRQTKANAAVDALYKRLEEQARLEFFGEPFSLR